MDEQQILVTTQNFVKKQLEGEGSGHDWWHIERVRTMALYIAQEEGGCDLFIVEMAALLHDVADPKLHGGDNSQARRELHSFVDGLGLEQKVRDHILYIVENSSFSRSLEGKDTNKTKEFMIVQDADRLDALGAIGIARCFMYSGHKNIVMHDPLVIPRENLTKQEYKGTQGTAVNHFYEKLFLLKDLMNTATAREVAQGRHRFMDEFLKRFEEEWYGKK